jgi:outer membrane protein TolC
MTNLSARAAGAASLRGLATRLRLPVLGAVLLVSGCAQITPAPVNERVLLAQSQTDRDSAQRGVEPLNGPLSLPQAMARALKYNLDRRSRMMEEAIALGQLDLSKFDMLPRLMASAGYRHRSEDSTTRAVDSVTGAPSLANPFISSSRDHTLADVGATWNLLDFGLSYVNAQQNADRVLIAAERRRKASHILLQDVRTAFWRTASAQKLRASIAASIILAEEALTDSRKAEQERLRSPIDSLRYQRQLLENLRLLEGIDQELASAQVELANQINAPAGTDVKVIEPTEELSDAILARPIEALETSAIANNADLREQHYNVRLAQAETRKVLYKLFPNLNLNANLKYDTDKYLVHERWNETGVQLSFNLLNLLTAPAQQRLADAGVALADQRRVTMQMAVLSQMHLARLYYANALKQFRRADAIWAVDERINQHGANRAQAENQGKLEQVSNNTTAILSLLRRYQALSLAHAASSKLQAVLGEEPATDSQVGLPLAELSAAIAASTGAKPAPASAGAQ